MVWYPNKILHFVVTVVVQRRKGTNFFVIPGKTLTGGKWLRKGECHENKLIYNTTKKHFLSVQIKTFFKTTIFFFMERKFILTT